MFTSFLILQCRKLFEINIIILILIFWNTHFLNASCVCNIMAKSIGVLNTNLEKKQISLLDLRICVSVNLGNTYFHMILQEY